MSASRWWREFARPSEKCRRVGHAVWQDRVRVFLYPPRHPFSAVADRAIEVTPRCSRCRWAGKPTIEERSGLQGLTMPGDHWERLRKNGRFPR